MNRLFTELDLNKRRIILAITATTVFILSKIFDFIEVGSGNERNAYDFIFFIIDDYYFLTYFASMIFLVLIYNTTSKHEFCKYCLLRYGSKVNWYLNELLLLLLNAIFFTVVVVFICILVSIGKFSFNNSSVYISNIKSLKSIHPLILLSINLALLTAYLYLVGLVYFISNLRFKHNFLGAITSITLMVGVLNIIPYESRNAGLSKFNAVYNVMLASHDYINDMTQISFIFSIIFFISMISVLIILGYIFVKKWDIPLGDRTE